MIDAIIQFVRNLLCCIKDMEYFSNTWLYNDNVVQEYYDLPEPLSKTTPLEIMISIVQFYVVYSGVPNSLRLITTSYGKLQRIHRLLDYRRNNNNKKQQRTTTTDNNVDQLVHESLVKEGTMAIRSIFVGMNVLFISISFLWLAANSWHITDTDILGGLPAVMHALTIMNICLIPLLYYMYQDAKEQFIKVRRMNNLTNLLSQGIATTSDVGLSSFETITGWLPFWDSGMQISWGEPPLFVKEREIRQLKFEKSRLQTMLTDIVGGDDNVPAAAEATTNKNVKKDGSISTTQVRKNKAIQQMERAEELQDLIQMTKMEGYREYLYFILNTIACYGYSLCILVYYWPDELEQPTWLRHVMLHYANPDADWGGNFAGDLMWTIEPIIVLASPMYLSRYVRRKPKVKQA